MTKKRIYLQQLAEYFISTGRVLTKAEYDAATDTPIRSFFIKRTIGNWARMEKLLKTNHPEVYEVIKPEPVKPVVKVPTVVKAPVLKEEPKDELQG